MLQSWSYLISLREYVRIPSSHFSWTQTFGSTSSMLDHGLQQLLHALTHDTNVLRIFISHGNQRRISVYILVFHIILLSRRVRIFIEPLVDIVLQSRSESMSAAYSITARSASLRMPLTRCSVDLLHLDQFSWTMSNVGGTPRPFRASTYLGLTQVVSLERRICRLCHALNHWLLSQPLIFFGQSSEFLQPDLHLLPQSVLHPST